MRSLRSHQRRILVLVDQASVGTSGDEISFGSNSEHLETKREAVWKETTKGNDHPTGVVVAHDTSTYKPELSEPAAVSLITRELRALGGPILNEGFAAIPAADSAGDRARPERPDEFRSCFERDRDRILHSAAFRRLSGKTQVFIFPEDHQRTRLTHALEVAQIARAICSAAGLNVDLAEAAALGHDCGHGPGGHPSEDLFSEFVPGGFDHATWGADVVLEPLNLCSETLDAIRNHSWSRPAPITREGEVVSWADRIAYVCHDFEDAMAAGVVSEEDLPETVIKRCGVKRSEQIRTFIGGVLDAITSAGVVGMTPDIAEALADFRAANYRKIYFRPESIRQGHIVKFVLRQLVEHFIESPGRIAVAGELPVGLSPNPASRLDEELERSVQAVKYVAGMTDRFALRYAREELGIRNVESLL